MNLKSSKIMSLTACLTLLLLSFNTYASGSQASPVSKIKKVKRIALSAKTKKSVVNAFKVNEKLHASFFKYDAKKVESNAVKLKKAIKAIKDKKISKIFKFTKARLDKIKAGQDREINNKNYHSVSIALIQIIKKFDLGTKHNAYGCPMVQKKWVQNSKKMKRVHNPYAPEMPHCGAQRTRY